MIANAGTSLVYVLELARFAYNPKGAQ